MDDQINSITLDQANNDNIPSSTGTIAAGVVNANTNTAALVTHQEKYHASQGGGFAAEQANNLYDLLTGKNAKIVGGNNAKDGADRLVNGISIQTKYCADAARTVSSAFNEQGQYRYLNPDGSLMQLEVPSDQFNQAVKEMAKRIENGMVPGVTDPKDAVNIVRRGSVTYRQARNIAKFGTIESLTFDAVNASIISASAFGITALISYAKSLWDSNDHSIAIENAIYTGLQIGGASFATSIITAQLAKAGLNRALTAPTDFLVKEILGPKVSAQIANALRDGATIHGAAAMNNVSKLLRGNIITACVMTAVLSVKDIRNAFNGRISGKQLFKNIMTIAGGMAGGTGGFILGTMIGGPVVGVLVSFAGGSIGGIGTNAVIGQFIEDDAIRLVKIVEDSFCQLIDDYMLSQKEIDIVLDDLSITMDAEQLLNMFASPDHVQFAEVFVSRLIERNIAFRNRIYLPTEEEVVKGFGRVVEETADGRVRSSMTSESGNIDPMAIAAQLTGRESNPRAARKAMYVAKQMNSVQAHAEEALKKIPSDNKKSREKIASIYDKRANMQEELANIYGEGTK